MSQLRNCQRLVSTMVLLLIGLLALSCLPAVAQYDDDDATRDYEEQDRRYLERLKGVQKVFDRQLRQ